MEIKVQVELYLYPSTKETVEVCLSTEDILSLAEDKALNEYACVSCQAKDISFNFKE